MAFILHFEVMYHHSYETKFNWFSSPLQYVLAVGSSVFHAMFYGELAEDKEEIRIPDVEPASFLAMLK